MKSKFLFFLMLPLFLLAGCSKEDDNPADDYGDKTVDDAYYVRYEVHIEPQSQSATRLKEITFMSERGLQSFKTSASDWNAIYGPFAKGDSLCLKVKESKGFPIDGSSYARLFVSRNSEPFVVKAEQISTSDAYLSLSYTIDF